MLTDLELQATAAEVRKLAMTSGVLTEYATHPDGDCLFSSVAAIMRGAPPAHQDVINEHVSRNGLRFTCCTVTPKILRFAVAATALDDRNEVMNAALAQWIEIAKCAKAENDRQLLIEYGHVACAIDDGDTHGDTSPAPPPPLSGSDAVPFLNKRRREAIFDAMCTRAYWGEQIALQILRGITGIALVVLDESARVLFQFHVDDDERGDDNDGRDLSHQVFGLLHLQGRHYQPLGHENRLAFFEYELPYVIAVGLTSPQCKERISPRLRVMVEQAKKLFAVVSSSS